jgi:hypothetical protein
MPTCKVFIALEILTTPKEATTPFALDHLGIALRTGWYPGITVRVDTDFEPV